MSKGSDSLLGEELKKEKPETQLISSEEEDAYLAKASGMG